MTHKKEKTMVKLPLEGKLAPKATDEVAAEGGKKAERIRLAVNTVRSMHLIHRIAVHSRWSLKWKAK